MGNRLVLWIFLSALLFFLTMEATTIDPYKVLGVERNASQREIQKAFHKLSLQYHPDKNKNKGAQAKFSEINNAYEILSDEEKRKNYDTYGDEKGSPGFGAGSPGDHGGYTYFTNGGPGKNQFTYGPSDWQSMGGQGGSKSFSFSFGGPSGPSSFGFGMDDIFSNLFGGKPGGGGQFGGFSGSTGSRPGSQPGSRGSPVSISAISSQVYKKEIVDQGMTWLLLSYTPSLKGHQHVESVIKEVASSLQGALKIGSINCETEPFLCKDLGIYPRRMPRVFVYSYKLHDVSDPTVKKLGVDALPAIVGWLSNGEKHVLKAGITIKDMKSAINELSALLEGFEKKNKKASSSQAKKSPTGEKQIPLLTESNFDALCGEKTPVCIIGAFRSSKERKKLESILNTLSQKSLSRQQNSADGRDSISYTLLDASKKASFLNAFDKAGFKSLDKVLVAYKPRRRTFAAFEGEMTTEEVERFIGSVLNGDIRFTKTRQKPVLK
ncbi:dnaJ protein ERDJ3A-like isoform X2 [Prunus dulcis]|uniref:dnaJ protein ERDJ3A-like isoform X2 n=1 Tax=Prunus dulcis TaxID=3755 RepID=UPI001482F427|nr:dnaJ protein ERDJ3A-like isoform X2 [Prunus dulcis]XP_034222693.1 dnaJ protein ERDJ3A-like isoform X2 [Prunus dulcis]